jgi:hypothetical protein
MTDLVCVWERFEKEREGEEREREREIKATNGESADA